MAADALGKRLVRALLEEKNLSILTEGSVTAADLFEDGLDAYNWVLEYFNTRGEWPTPKMVEENTAIALPDEKEPLSYVADLVRQRTLGRSIEKDLRRAAEMLEGRKADAALEIMCESAMRHNSKRLVTKATSYREGSHERVKAYTGLAPKKGFVGVPTPWMFMNKAIQGWVNGTFNVVTAMQNTGKTWFACVTAEEALKVEERVLFVSLEMSVQRIARRIDAYRHKIPFGKLRDADIDDDKGMGWMDSILKDKEGKGDIIFADKQLVKTVGDVVALVYEHKPTLVVIDGGYRFQVPGKSKGQWDQTVQIVHELQISAERTDIPWVVTTQQGDSSETGKAVKRGPHMRAWNVRYGKEWVIDPDVVIGLYADEDLRLIKMLEVHILKMRDNDGDSSIMSKINWDTHTMNFREVEGASPVKAGPVDAAHEVEY